MTVAIRRTPTLKPVLAAILASCCGLLALVPGAAGARSALVASFPSSSSPNDIAHFNASDGTSSFVQVPRTPFSTAASANGSTGYAVYRGSASAVSAPSAVKIDATTNRIVGQVALGGYPYAGAPTPDDRYLYVGNDSGFVDVVDFAADKKVATISSIARPRGIAIVDPDGPGGNAPRAYVASYDPNPLQASVKVIDTATNQIVGSVVTGLTPFGVAASADGSKVYVTDMATNGAPGSENKVSVIDTAANVVERSIPLPGCDQPWSVSADAQNDLHIGCRLSYKVAVVREPTGQASVSYVSVGAGINPYGIATATDAAGNTFAYVRLGSDRVAVIDKSNLTVVANVSVGASSTATSAPFNVALAPDPDGGGPQGPKAYVANSASHTVSVLAALGAPSSVVDTIESGSTRRQVAIDPDGKLAYVLASGSGRIAVVDVAKKKLVETIATPGDKPYGAAIDPKGKYLYVSNSGSNDVSVLELASRKFVAESIPAGEQPRGIVVSRDGKTAYVANFGADNLTKLDNADDPAAIVADPAAIDLGVANPHNLALTPGGDQLFVTHSDPESDPGANHTQVSIVNTGDESVTLVNAGQNPVDVAIAPDPDGAGPAGPRAFVTAADFDTVRVFDTKTKDAIRTIALGPGSAPYGVASSPDGRKVFVAKSSGTMLSTINNASEPGQISEGGAIGTAPRPEYLAVTANRAPVASLFVSSDLLETNVVRSGQAATFIGLGSKDRDGGQISSASWDFGDGTTGGGLTATHTYDPGNPSPVDYTVPVRLGVRDSEGGGFGTGEIHNGRMSVQTASAQSELTLPVTVVDGVAPETELKGTLPAELSNESTATFEFEVAGEPDAEEATFVCALDPADPYSPVDLEWGALGDYEECGTGASGAKQYEDLANGEHTFYVRAIDDRSNVDSTPATYTWTVDTTAPAVDVVNQLGEPSPASDQQETVAAPPAAADGKAPTVTFNKPGRKQLRKALRRGLKLAGQASDPESGIQQVEISFALRKSKSSCRFADAKGRLGKKATACSKPRFFRAAGGESWQAGFGRLVRGRYVALVRATDKSGNTSSAVKLKLKLG